MANRTAMVRRIVRFFMSSPRIKIHIQLNSTIEKISAVILYLEASYVKQKQNGNMSFGKKYDIIDDLLVEFRTQNGVKTEV